MANNIDPEYEALVREQLDALGYDAAAIPDDLLRHFLADFENKLDLQNNQAGPDQPTPSPQQHPRPRTAEPANTHSPRIQHSPSRLATTPSHPPSRLHTPSHTPSHTLSRSALGPRAVSSASLIRPSSSLPRRARTDVVDTYARHAQAWQGSAFLQRTGRRPLTPLYLAPPPTPRHKTRVQKAAVDYVVPTTKRRDKLVWETRMRMRQTEPSTVRRSRTMRVNTYQVPSEKRRDALRWRVRSEMALAD